jgi:hypothetical protein
MKRRSPSPALEEKTRRFLDELEATGLRLPPIENLERKLMALSLLRLKRRLLDQLEKEAS